ncbi:hypothetical protein DFP72DRAFT_853900 [Ephemerocybe angulata]|uniref:Uncharacterized protein n=1 Tax=Ephemerocybe angulata TaxID=980116 RepID=A0A8H6M1C3_9AGAR|nr:hypothetical protein DFP72DRAFT_853900 [Tulosesus angulatus]
MPRKALSKEQQAQLDGQEKAALYTRAADLYRKESIRILKPGERRKGLQITIEQVQHAHFVKTNKKSQQEDQRGTSIQDFNEEKSHLTPGETEVVIKVLLELASWGHPFLYLHLKEHVDQILHGRLGDKFSAKGVRQAR